MVDDKQQIISANENNAMILPRESDNQLTPEAREWMVDDIEDTLRISTRINEAVLCEKYHVHRTTLRKYVLEAAERIRQDNVKRMAPFRAYVSNITDVILTRYQNKGEDIKDEEARFAINLLQEFENLSRSESKSVENIQDARRAVQFNSRTTIFATPRTAKEYMKTLEKIAKGEEAEEQAKKVVDVTVTTHESDATDTTGN